MMEFLWGATAMGAATAALFLGRFWSVTRDRLFLLFALAFVALALNWTVLAVARPSDEARHLVYLLRLLGYLLIIGAIVDKNRNNNRRA
jgi:hypothetical protein